MSFILYLVGLCIFIIGLAFGAHRLGVNNFWIGVGVITFLGIGILSGVAQTRQKDPPKAL